MLQIRDLYNIQAQASVAATHTQEGAVPFGDYLASCREFVTRELPAEYHMGKLSQEQKNTIFHDTIMDFLNKHKIPVKGYVNADGGLMLDLLMQDVLDQMNGLGVLKAAFLDPEIDEIQVVDHKTIFVVRKGVLEPYVSAQGQYLSFLNDTEVRVTLGRLIEDNSGSTPTLTPGQPLLDAKTAKEGYRVSAVDSTVNARSRAPWDFPITSIVYRKFKEVMLTLDDLVRTGSITAKMGRFVLLLAEADLKLFCVGPTGSGKTTLLNIVANATPRDKRLIAIQNPTEVVISDRDPETGRNRRNVEHWEVTTYADMSALLAKALRSTPDILMIGEARLSEEFTQIVRGMQTGQRFLGTFHAEDAVDAMGRCSTELVSGGSMRRSEALALVTGCVDIIISQYRFPNGARRVMEIAEIQGVTETGEPKVNVLFKYVLSGKVEIDANGKKNVLGEFKQVGTVSEALFDKFYKVGITEEQLHEFMVPGEA